MAQRSPALNTRAQGLGFARDSSVASVLPMVGLMVKTPVGAFEPYACGRRELV
jgi:hypothetical protein